jgi:hypothetical protein
MLYRPSPKSQNQKKMPHEKPGQSQRSFSRRASQPLRHRRVAWLTAFQPITVAGPRPIFTAFPAAHAYKLKIECMSCPPVCQRVNKTPLPKIIRAFSLSPELSKLLLSDSSNLVCAFPPAPAILPVNPPTCTIRSEKYSWNASVRLSRTSPFHQVSPFLPSSAPARNGW